MFPSQYFSQRLIWQFYYTYVMIQALISPLIKPGFELTQAFWLNDFHQVLPCICTSEWEAEFLNIFYASFFIQLLIMFSDHSHIPNEEFFPFNSVSSLHYSGHSKHVFPLPSFFQGWQFHPFQPFFIIWIFQAGYHNLCCSLYSFSLSEVFLSVRDQQPLHTLTLGISALLSAT